MRKRAKKIWHDFFYLIANKRMKEFGMYCRDVSEIIDFNSEPKNFSEKFRYRLHMSFCQACKNYEGISKALRKAAQEPKDHGPLDDVKIEKLNKDLVMKYAIKNKDV